MKKSLVFAALIVGLFYSSSLFAQDEIPPMIYKITEKITLDGRPDEKIWEKAEMMSDFRQYFPADTSAALIRTEVRMLYDDNFLYVSLVCYDSLPGDYYIASLRRDFRGRNNDGVTLILDTFSDKTNAFIFGINPAGVMREGLVAGDNFDLAWDNKWYGDAHISEGKWTAEMMIPFNTMRFKAGVKSWNMNFYRVDSKSNERSAWTPVPRNQQIFLPAYNRQVNWEEPLKKSGANISFIPYLSGGVSRNHSENEATKSRFEAGADAKIAVTPSLNLDLTVNPDFSQVEVDQQVTNLDRFEVFFPERRQFFMENADLFGNFGFDNSRPFFSRRIGVARDTLTGQNIQNRILFGARLSGKLDQNWRMGFLNMQAAKDDAAGLPSINYTVAALQRKVLKRSNIGAYLVNKQSFTNSETGAFTLAPGQYNRTAGMQFNYASEDNKYGGLFFVNRSFSPGGSGDQVTHGGGFAYTTNSLSAGIGYQHIGQDFNAEVGYVPRTGILQTVPNVKYNFYPESDIFVRIGLSAEYSFIFMPENGLTDVEGDFAIDAVTKSNIYMRLGHGYNYVYLFNSFDPSNTGGLELPAGSDYKTHYAYGKISSDFRRPFYFEMTSYAGQYYNGTLVGSEGSVNYRFGKYGIFALNYSVNQISLPEPYKSSNLVLLGPRLDLTFTKKLFWTTFVQYNNQLDNLNINTRLQWRFKPVSDLFIVYTDNYFAESLGVKNRALVFKLSYWINM